MARKGVTNGNRHIVRKRHAAHVPPTSIAGVLGFRNPKVLKQRGIGVRIGMEATGYSRWFERLLAELGFELWIGDPAENKANE